jgi:hypothetical protein
MFHARWLQYNDDGSVRGAVDIYSDVPVVELPVNTVDVTQLAETFTELSEMTKATVEALVEAP